MQTFASTRRLLRFLAHRVPSLFRGALALSVVVTLSEGVGLLLLLPLLAAAGVETRAGGVGGISVAVERALATLGLTPTVTTVLLLFFLTMVAHEVASGLRISVNARLYARVGEVLRRDLFRAISGSRWVFLVRKRRSDLVSALTQDVERTVIAVWSAHSAVVALAVGTLYLAMAGYVSLPMTALVAVTGALTYLAMMVNLSRAADIGTRTGERVDTLYGLATEFIGGMKTIRSYGRVEDSVGRFDDAVTSLGEANAEDGVHQARMEAVFKIGAAFGLCAIVYAAVEILELATGDLLFLLVLFARVMPKLTLATRDAFRFASHVTSFDNVANLIDECERHAEQTAPAPSGSLHHEVSLEIRDLRFAYAPGRTVLDGVSLQIPAHSITALVGASGAGKTTLLDLTMGLIEAQSGTILLNDQPLDPARAADLRARIGYVSQEPFLFNGSVRDNLAWAVETATEEEMHAALNLASADFVHRLPEGLDASIGDRGAALSGGQRQRLSLARALLRRPSLLILDEATSALDGDNERRILDAVRSLRENMTVLIVSHRASAVRDADLVHVLERGRIVRSGEWDPEMMQTAESLGTEDRADEISRGAQQPATDDSGGAVDSGAPPIDLLRPLTLDVLLGDANRAAEAARQLSTERHWEPAAALCRGWKALPLLQRRVAELAIEPPEPVSAAFAAEQRRAFQASATALRCGAGALSMLEEHGIDAVGFKGVAAITGLHGGPQGRTLTDADVMVRSDDLARAVEVLAAAGLQRDLDTPLDEYVEFVRAAPGFADNEALSLFDARGTEVDLHWRAGRVTLDSLLDGSVVRDVYGRSARFTGAADGYLTAAQHLVRNGLNPDVSVRDLDDALGWLHEVAGPESLRKLWDRAAKLGLDVAAAAVVEILAHYRPDEPVLAAAREARPRVPTDAAGDAAALADLYFAQVREGPLEPDLLLLRADAIRQVLRGLGRDARGYRALMRSLDTRLHGAPRSVGGRLRQLVVAALRIGPAGWRRTRALARTRRLSGP